MSSISHSHSAIYGHIQTHINSTAYAGKNRSDSQYLIAGTSLFV